MHAQLNVSEIPLYKICWAESFVFNMTSFPKMCLHGSSRDTGRTIRKVIGRWDLFSLQELYHAHYLCRIFFRGKFRCTDFFLGGRGVELKGKTFCCRNLNLNSRNKLNAWNRLQVQTIVFKLHTVLLLSCQYYTQGNIMYVLTEWEGRRGKYLARGPYVLTVSQIFSRPARPYSVNKHFIIWPLAAENFENSVCT